MLWRWVPKSLLKQESDRANRLYERAEKSEQEIRGGRYEQSKTNYKLGEEIYWLRWEIRRIHQEHGTEIRKLHEEILRLEER